MMAEARPERPPLDEVMLAMDVVDTLRHRQLLVERELNSEDRDSRMIERLREIYRSQGIEVPDHVLLEGVSALKEDRFAYDPPSDGLQVFLARLYVSRIAWGRPLLIGAAVLVLVWLAYLFFVRGPAEREIAALPAQLESRHQAVLELSKDPEAERRAATLFSRGEGAIRDGDHESASRIIEELESLQRELDKEYVLRIVSRPGEPSGVWRIPEANPDARNYYIIVEAIDDDGRVVRRPIVNEEDGKTYEVDKWALRVEQDVFERIASDKRDDGIIQNNRFGAKIRGRLTPEYDIPTTGQAITSW